MKEIFEKSFYVHSDNEAEKAQKINDLMQVTTDKINVLKEKKSLFGKKKKVYTTEVMSLKDFVGKSIEWKQGNSVFIQEIIISKLALMTFSA